MPGEDEVLRCKMPFGIEREPEEQQMPDFSDWGSTGSAEEIQVMDDSEPAITFPTFFIGSSPINLFSIDSISRRTVMIFHNMNHNNGKRLSWSFRITSF